MEIPTPLVPPDRIFVYEAWDIPRGQRTNVIEKLSLREEKAYCAVPAPGTDGMTLLERLDDIRPVCNCCLETGRMNAVFDIGFYALIGILLTLIAMKKLLKKSTRT